ncbi:MAG: Mut7-C ubiquitin/RNAse domain-containing protein [candidate division KSB1 bacterium]|nr:Mut7-C ubiquitin/RNAse domain-containing protein [candidate division KSB1 bacterium]
MNQVQFRFYGKLNDLLPEDRRGKAVLVAFNNGQTVKHLIESLGVPHTEVQGLRANGAAIDFTYQVRHGDQIEIYPAVWNDSDRPVEGEWRFVLDNHLGRLAVYLRMLGFDALYRNDYQDEELARLCDQEGRILLTRDKRLLMRNAVKRGYWIRSKVPRHQLEEVVQHFGLTAAVRPFQRCLRCNSALIAVSKEEVLDRLQPLTKLYYDEFHLCPACNQIYWKGSHYERMQQMIQQVLRPQG